MVDPQIISCKQTGSNKKDNRGTKKRSKNFKRKIKRKRKEFKYYKKLKKQRTVRITEPVEVVDSVNMNWSSTLATTSAQLPADIIEWQKLDQMAYWKSRALGLELENRMLRQHLKNAYSKSIEDYINKEQKNGMKTTKH